MAYGRASDLYRLSIALHNFVSLFMFIAPTTKLYVLENSAHETWSQWNWRPKAHIDSTLTSILQYYKTSNRIHKKQSSLWTHSMKLSNYVLRLEATTRYKTARKTSFTMTNNCNDFHEHTCEIVNVVDVQRQPISE